MNSNQASLFPEHEAKYCYDNEDDILVKLAKFVIERHMVYLRRYHEKLPAPWTNDPILGNFRFCNIYREIDTVSQWIINNVIEPNEDNPNLPVLLALSRLINWPDTLQFLIDREVWPEDRFDQESFYEAMKERQSVGKFITGSYMISTIFPKAVKWRDHTKAGYIADVAAPELWLKRKELAKAGTTSMEGFVNTIGKLHGWGSFMTYQVVVDLSYSKKWLGKAADRNTFNSPGNGTKKGLTYCYQGRYKGKIPPKDFGPLIIEQRKKLNSLLKKMVPAKLWTGDPKTGFAPLTMSNVSNANCEFSKHYAVYTGSRDRLKSSYTPRNQTVTT